MIYLDYSATTPINEDVLNTYIKTSKDFIGNTNSLHMLGVKNRKLEASATKQIASLLGVCESEIIYTSGASEANNTALKGIAYAYKNRGLKILTTNLEHSSIDAPLEYLKKQGFIVEYLKTDDNGLVLESDLLKHLKDEPILVSINAVNSETGVRQDCEKLGSIIKKNSKAIFHVDATQAIGKVKIDLKNIDLCSFSAHKFYGPVGIGILVKKNNINIEPLIHGGKSTTSYRSGTQALPLIASISKALRLSLDDLDSKYLYVSKLRDYLIDNLKKYPKVKINSNAYSIPHILNISLLDVKPETLQHALEEYNIYISTGSACSNYSVSKAVLEVTKSSLQAAYSVRISLSSLTTKEEIETFLEKFDLVYKKLVNE